MFDEIGKKISDPIRELPENSEIEDSAEEFFLSKPRFTEQETDEYIKKVFAEVCGDHGRQEFFEITVPLIKRIYGNNFSKVGMRLLDIIDEGASLRPDKVGNFFRNPVSTEELEFSKRPKEEIVGEITDAIEKLILEKSKEFGKNYEGVIAVVIYGSYANNNFSLGSDLDVVYITKSKEEGVFLKKEERYVHYLEDFSKGMKKAVKPETGHDFVIFSIDDEKEFKENLGKDANLSTNFIVISPFPETKKKVEETIKSVNK
jgi:predicted nucleotidyltransferase